MQQYNLTGDNWQLQLDTGNVCLSVTSIHYLCQVMLVWYKLLVWYCVCLSVCSFQAGIVSRWLNRLSWFFGTQSILGLSYSVAKLSSKIMVLLWNFVPNSGIRKISPRPVKHRKFGQLNLIVNLCDLITLSIHCVVDITWVVGYWCGYLSGARCRFAYGPAAILCLLHQ